MNYLPRPGDLPREELVALADETILKMGGPERCQVFFKFTCVHCGERCTFTEPNALYEKGSCVKCGKTTKINFGGFSIHLKLKAR